MKAGILLEQLIIYGVRMKMFDMVGLIVERYGQYIEH